jgi:hypothetical protein
MFRLSFKRNAAGAWALAHEAVFEKTHVQHAIMTEGGMMQCHFPDVPPRPPGNEEFLRY